MNIPNILTLLRVALIPIFILLFYMPYHWSYLAAALVFTLASVTDWLDGYLARKLQQSTPFGAFLDPVADKLLVVMALVLLTANFPSPWFVLPTAVIIGREVFISALREWMASRNQRDAVAVAYVGKLKTTVQMIAIIVLLAYSPEYPYWLLQIGYGLIYLAAALSLWSMVIYVKNAWPSLK